MVWTRSSTRLQRLGGIDQWITIRAQNRANPIVLLVHGGPASPLTPTRWQFQRPLEVLVSLLEHVRPLAMGPKK
jgi:hypothetical protein